MVSYCLLFNIKSPAKKIKKIFLSLYYLQKPKITPY